MPPSTWNPDQYARFRDERAKPFFDLLTLVQPRPDMRVVDLGCGTGELTRALHQHVQAHDTLGLDSSDTMLAKSSAFSGDGLHFVQGDISAFSPQAEYDLIFSNAVFQWLPNHEQLLAHLTRGLRPGGQLAFQVPANDDFPSHTVAADIAQEAPFAAAMTGYARRWPNLSPEGYAMLLDRLGYRAQHVRLQVYGHHLPSRDDVVEWVKGSLLTDYEKRLTPALYAQFLVRYRERLLPRLESQQPFFYPFKRILVWAQR